MSEENEDQRALTLGEMRVARNFNPEANQAVEGFKSRYAVLIDELEEMRDLDNPRSEKNRTISRAQTHAEDACMLSVKSIFQ